MNDIIERAKRLFSITEIVAPEIYHEIGDAAWSLFRPELLETIITLKEVFKDKQIIMNTWGLSQAAQIMYGFYSERGLRSPRSKTGAKNSPHKTGKAIDFDIWVGTRRLEPSDVRKQVLERIDLFPHIKGMEIGINWCHFDVMHREGRPDGGIMVFSPKGFVENISRKKVA